MINVEHVSKRFKLSGTERKAQKKKAADSNVRQDPRSKGHWFEAVRDVSFEVGPGDVLGLLGPNGAGKTTTLRMLSTALQPSGGRIMVDGIDLVSQPLEGRRKIGFLSGSTGLYRRLSVRENVAYFARLHGMEKSAIDARIDELFERLDMHSFAGKRADDLSTGMRQKTAIARTVVHHPKVVVFDEPTTGLDVMAARTILDFIEHYKEQGIPVIFSTHHLHEVERLCNRVTVITEGTASFSGTTDAFRETVASATIYDAFVQLADKRAA
jgi:sodium transport system ATP-binding protein